MDYGFADSHRVSTPWVITFQKRVVNISEGFTSLTGYTRDEVIGKRPSDLWHMLRLSPEIEITDGFFSGQHFIFTKSFDAREVVIFAESDENDEFTTYLMQETLDSSLENRFPIAEQILQANQLGVAIFKAPEIILLRANQTFLNFLDGPYRQRENSIGKHIGDIITGWKGSTSEKIWEDTIKSEKPFHMEEYRYDRFDRGETYWNVTLTPVIEDGRAKYYVEFTSDITETVLNRKRIEEQNNIIKEQKEMVENILKMQEEFFSFMSHEFKTPLSVIMAAIQTMELLCKQELTDKSWSLLRKIRQSTLQQIRLVNNLLDITRADAGYLKVNKKNRDLVKVTSSITNSVIPYAANKGVNIRFSSNVPELISALDDEKYERVILNLLSNAIKFTPENKSIYVNLSILEGEQVCVEIKDEGVGIPKDKHEHIFSRFGQVSSTLTRNSEGTGIGLCLVKMLVENCGGKILMESEEGIGSSFKIKIPIMRLEEDLKPSTLHEFMDNSLVENLKIEFSNIYLD